MVASLVIGGSALIGGGLSAYGATKAANTQASAEAQALGLQQQEQQYLRNQAAPFITAGQGAANTLSTLTGAGGQAPNYAAFTNSPDYAFALSQGNAALQNYLNANGISGSGAGITAAVNYNQGLATQQYGNYFNRLMQIATLGNNAVGNIAGPSASTAGGAANTIGNIGTSRASGIVGGTNAVTGALNSGVNNALLYNAINRGGNPSGYGTPNSPYPNFADLGLGNGVGTGGFNFIDQRAS